MTATPDRQPIREVRRLAETIYEGAPAEAAVGEGWADACQRAYQLVKDAAGPDAEPTMIEPYGLVNGRFEWRTYFHPADGNESVYAPVIEVRGIDLDLVVKLLRRDHGLATAYVEQTGGGCATIYAGATRPHEQATENDPWVRWAALAGPGQYGWGKRPSVATLDEFYIGPDDDGETGGMDARDVGALTHEKIAALIALQASMPDRLPTTDELEAIGLDGTGRGFFR